MKPKAVIKKQAFIGLAIRVSVKSGVRFEGMYKNYYHLNLFFIFGLIVYV